ncbi:hypothetical protein GOODEAATRI_033131 [Goodea atripinnis]|uniref:Uncharacterized protein n=1 Tax=Goodea atripinnis TaxID=208336 RepID=A0ABV0PTM0_9TELE
MKIRTTELMVHILNASFVSHNVMRIMSLMSKVSVLTNTQGKGARGMAKKTPLTTSYVSPKDSEALGFCNPVRRHTGGSLLHQEEQLAQSAVLGEKQAPLWSHSNPHKILPPTKREAMALRSEVEELQHERFLLQQSQQRISADLADSRAIQTGMLQIMNAAEEAKHGQLEGTACAKPLDPPVDGEMMSELQILRSEALLANHSPSSAQLVRQMATGYQQVKSDHQVSSHAPFATPQRNMPSYFSAPSTMRFSSTTNYRPIAIQTGLPQQLMHQPALLHLPSVPEHPL